MGTLPGLDLLGLVQPEFLLQESSQVLLTLGKTTQLFQQQNKPLAGKATLPIIPSPAYPWRFPLVSALIQATEDKQPPGMGAGGRSQILILPTRGGTSITGSGREHKGSLGARGTGFQELGPRQGRQHLPDRALSCGAGYSHNNKAMGGGGGEEKVPFVSQASGWRSSCSSNDISGFAVTLITWQWQWGRARPLFYFFFLLNNSCK